MTLPGSSACAVLAAALLAACTLDITDLPAEPEDQAVPAALMVHVEVDADDVSSGWMDAHIEVVVYAGRDAAGRTRTVVASPFTFGDTTADPSVDAVRGVVRWRLERAMPMTGDTFRLVPPEVHGVARRAPLSIVVALDVDPSSEIVLPPEGGPVRSSIAGPVLTGLEPDAGAWSARLQAISLSAQGAPPATIELSADLVRTVTLPADLRLTSFQRFGSPLTTDSEYAVAVQTSASASIPVRREGG